MSLKVTAIAGFYCNATILLIDIDHFKKHHQIPGHDVGDKAIVALTRQLQMSVRSGDAIGRLGGDEFAVIMSQTAAESAIAVMSRVHERLETLSLPCAPKEPLRISVVLRFLGAKKYIIGNGYKGGRCGAV